MAKIDYQDKKRKRKRQIRIRVTLTILLLILLAAGAFWYVKFAPNTKKMDPKTYFETMLGRAVTSAGTEQAGSAQASLAEDEAAIMLEDHVSEMKARLYEGAVYLPYELVRGTVSTRFFLDEERQLMLLTTAVDNLEIPFNSAAYTSADDGKEYTFDRAVVLSDERGLYLDAEFLGRYVNVETLSFEDMAHVLVNYRWGGKTGARLTKNAKVRFGPGVKNVIVTEAEKDDTVYLLEYGEKWNRVATQDGYIGYLPVRCLSEPETIPFSREFDTSSYTSNRMEGQVNLVWHQIDLKQMNKNLKEDTKEMTGVNVISPTWFFLSDNEGGFENLGEASYVKRAHKMGLAVWGLVSNFSPDMSTSVLVSSTAARRALAKNLLDAALELNLDGINLDLEAIQESAGYGYVQFVREMSVLCRKNGLVLSVDVPVPFDFNAYYDRAELGLYADYVIMMGYDEHYYGSEAGSVASLPFEENGINRTLEEVPAEKIISGVPFYTRIWYTGMDGSVWSETLRMDTVTRTLETYGVTPVWNGETGQYYAEWTLEDGIVCRIWIEDETSLAMKADLVYQNKLGGIAAWVLGNERSTIWEVITRSLAGEASEVVAEQLAQFQAEEQTPESVTEST